MLNRGKGEMKKYRYMATILSLVLAVGLTACAQSGNEDVETASVYKVEDVVLDEDDSGEMLQVGDGEERESLERQAAEQAPGKIVFLGARSNPYAIMDQMDAFLSTSRYEGQPLNIEEAKVIGLPVYCTKNLEQYTEDLTGFDLPGLEQAILQARKQPKHTDDLEAYNRRILESIYTLAGA